MSWFALIKVIHITAAVLSITGFLTRGLLLSMDIDYRHHRLTHALPHVLDTVLLATAIYMAVITAQYPVAQAWLTAKLVGLLLYIGLGTWALKWAHTAKERSIALALALSCFAYIVAVATTRSAWPV